MTWSIQDFNAEIQRLCAMSDKVAATAEALNLERRLRDAGPLPPQAIYGLAACYLRIGRHEDARARTMELISIAIAVGDLADISIGLAALTLAQELMLLLEVKDERFVEASYALASKMLSRDAAMLPAMAVVALRMLAGGRLEAYTRVRRRLAHVAGPRHLATNTALQRIMMCDPLRQPGRDEAQGQLRILDLPVLERRLSDAANATVVQLAGDDLYWSRFGDLATESVLKGDDCAVVHATVYAQKVETVALLRSLHARVGPRFGYTVAGLVSRAADILNEHGQARTFYSCIRFLALSELISAYGRPVLSLDLDVRLRRPLGPLLRRLSGADVAITVWPGQNPWHEIGAGFVLTASTAHGHRFAEYLKGYIQEMLLGGLGFWTLDQVGLWVAKERLIREGGFFKAVPPLEARRHVLFAGQFDASMGVEEKAEQLASAG